MRWVSSPSWDLFWIWSGWPIGIVLVGLYLLPAPQVLFYFFAAAIIAETAHAISPIILAWTHPGLRQIARQNPGQSIGLPLVMFGAATAIGFATNLGWTSYHPGPHQIYHVTDWTNPFPLLVWLYYFWNLYHFGMQNFGIARLIGIRGPRYIEMAICVGITAFLSAILSKWDVLLGFLVLGGITANHWLAEIGLCSKVSGRPWFFMAGILGFGTIGFLWLVPTPEGNLMHVVPAILCARLGLGFVHFLYDRWIWRHDSPVVRALRSQALA